MIANVLVCCQMLKGPVLGRARFGLAGAGCPTVARPSFEVVIEMKQKRGFVLGKREEEILKAVYFYRYMTALDVSCLLYSVSSLAHVRGMLSELAGGGDYVENEYLYRFPLQSGGGNRVRVFTLGSRGRDFFKTELEYPVTWYFRPDKVRHLSLGHLMHNLILTRFLVSAKMWARRRVDFRLLEVRTCYEMSSGDYPSVEMVREGKREQVSVIPDAWALFEVLEDGKWFAAPLLLEIDRGTAYKNKFKEHIASRLEFVREGGVYSRLFGRREVMIAYLTTGETEGFRESRRRAMCMWAREALMEANKESWASLFRFGSVAFEKVYDGSLFEDAVWYRPGSETPVGLFAG